jgi:hypothetical protein
LQEAIPEYTGDLINEITSTIGEAPTWLLFQKSLQITKGPFFHSDAAIDVAVFAPEALHPSTPCVPLGTHLDDWIVRRSFVMSEVLVLGYPPIPLTREAHLVAARAELNAVVTLTLSSKVQFVVSATPEAGSVAAWPYQNTILLLA